MSAKNNASASKKTEGHTVRARKKSQSSNTQRYLPFSEIRNDTVLMKNGGLRAILQVEPLNFNLKSETEQQGIINGYESFINTLVFPIQIVIRSAKVNIDNYVAHIEQEASGHTNPLLKQQSSDYAQFVKRIVEVADIMQKRFYIIIPLDDTPRKTTAFGRFFSWLNIDDTLNKALQRNRLFSSQSNRLKERINLVETGLQNIGLRTKRLKTMELIMLYYDIYNRNVSQTQKLTKHDDLNTAKNVL